MAHFGSTHRDGSGRLVEVKPAKVVSIFLIHCPAGAAAGERSWPDPGRSFSVGGSLATSSNTDRPPAHSRPTRLSHKRVVAVVGVCTLMSIARPHAGAEPPRGHGNGHEKARLPPGFRLRLRLPRTGRHRFRRRDPGKNG